MKGITRGPRAFSRRSRAPLIAATLVGIVAVGPLAESAAHAFVRVAASGRARVGEVHALVDDLQSSARLTLRLQLSGKAGRTTIYVPVPPGGTPRPQGSSDAIEAVYRRTLPRLEEWAAVEPCPKGTEMNPGPPKIWVAPPERKNHRGRWKAEVIDVAALKTKTERRVRPSDADVAALIEVAGPKGQVIAVTGRLGRIRSGWLPAIQVDLPIPVPPLAVGLGATFAPPGRPQRVTLMTRSSQHLWRPDGDHRRLAPVALFPEVAFETPVDLQQAVRHHAARRAGRPVVTEFEARIGRPPEIINRIGRYYFEQGSRSARPPMILRRAQVKAPVEPSWKFRRVWREPLTCAHPGFITIVQAQQRTQLKTYAVATGRRLPEITARTVERGYGITAQGTLTPVKIRRSERLQAP